MTKVKPSQITETDFRGLMAVFDAPDWHVNETLDKFRERGLIAPEPVDALEDEARAIGKEWREGRMPNYMKNGGADNVAYAALKRGMELAQPPLTRADVERAMARRFPHSTQRELAGDVDSVFAALTERQP